MSELAVDKARAFAAVRAVINQKRANEIRAIRSWYNGGVLGQAPKPAFPDMTDEEDQAIRRLWMTLDGSSCWMSALNLLCNKSNETETPT